MPKQPTGPTMNIFNFSQSTIANLNLGTQIGQIQNVVSTFNNRGLQDIASAIKALTEEIVASGDALNDARKQEAVELVATIGDEVAKPPEERRVGTLRAVGAALGGLVTHVDKVAAAYELLKAALRTQGIELP